jgi:hypothetical protein
MIGALFSLMAMTPLSVHAGGFTLPFGGRVAISFPCTCSAGLIWTIIVIGPRPGAFTYYFPTPMYSFYALLKPESAVKGTYIPFTGYCPMGVPPYCWVYPTLGTITNLNGSSLF